MNLQLVSVQRPFDDTPNNDAPPFVSLKDVCLAYDGDAGQLTLDHVSIDFRQGEFVVVVGPSGCGKSTLMKLVTGLLPPTTGRDFRWRKTGSPPDQGRRHGVSEFDIDAVAHDD